MLPSLKWWWCTTAAHIHIRLCGVKIYQFLVFFFGNPLFWGVILWVKILFNFCGWLDCMNIFFNEILCAIKQSISWHLLGAVQNGALKIYLCVIHSTIHSHGDEMSNFCISLHDFQLIFLLPDNYTRYRITWHRKVTFVKSYLHVHAYLLRFVVIMPSANCHDSLLLICAALFDIFKLLPAVLTFSLYHVTQNHFFFARLVCHWHHHFHIYHIRAVPQMQQGVTTLLVLIEMLFLRN